MYTTLVVLHVLAAVAGIGSAIFAFTLAPRVSPEDARVVMPYVGANAGTIGPIALVVLWVTGLWLVFGYGAAAAGGNWFTAKMALVVAITVFAVYGQIMRVRIARGADPRPVMAMMRRLSPFTTAVGILIVIFAVIAFG